MSDDTDPFEEARLDELATIPIADMDDEELGTLESECLSIGGRRGGRLRAALFELRRHRAMKRRLLEWVGQLDANRDKPGDVGKFIAAELRNRMAGP